MKYPVEALLRAPVEFWSACTSIAASALVVFLPDHMPLPRTFCWVAAILLVALGLLRLSQGLSILNYQRNLLNNQRWILKPNKIPQKHGMIFLGEGFHWTQKHTQRLVDTRRPECQKYLAHRDSFFTNWMKSRNRDLDFKRMPMSGRAELHGVETKKQPVWLNSADRVGHTLVLGTTRVGKTRLAELLISQDIRDGHVVLVFDPKGDTELLLRVYAEARRWGREKQFCMFHLGYPETSCRYNAIGRFSRITEVATRIASQLPSSGSSSAFREFAWRFVNIIAHALVALGKVPNYIKIRKYINDIEPLFIEYARNCLMRTQPAGWALEVKRIARSTNQRNLPSALKGRDAEAIALYQYVQTVQIDDPVLEGLVSAFKYDRTYFDKIVSSVGPLMEKLTTGPVSELISPAEGKSDPRPLMEWLDVIRSRGIVYVGLDALSDSTVAG
ncbi:MAG: conjugative transfer system coupling protein TraD, partial [Gammaproteobacteria bacterium]|nr:conjugative transfer system coupling protein TraD [Gammaproteobacteria bacterium]